MIVELQSSLTDDNLKAIVKFMNIDDRVQFTTGSETTEVQLPVGQSQVETGYVFTAT